MSSTKDITEREYILRTLTNNGVSAKQAEKMLKSLESEAEERGAKKMIAINRLIKKHKEELKELGL